MQRRCDALASPPLSHFFFSFPTGACARDNEGETRPPTSAPHCPGHLLARNAGAPDKRPGHRRGGRARGGRASGEGKEKAISPPLAAARAPPPRGLVQAPPGQGGVLHLPSYSFRVVACVGDPLVSRRGRRAGDLNPPPPPPPIERGGGRPGGRATRLAHARPAHTHAQHACPGRAWARCGARPGVTSLPCLPPSRPPACDRHSRPTAAPALPCSLPHHSRPLSSQASHPRRRPPPWPSARTSASRRARRAARRRRA